ncbi:MAG: EAL domain-containing protein [Legionella sp.]|nr:EAL domain-containing protein [Legionella sp.]
MSTVLQVEHAFVSFFPSKGKVETISIFSDGEIADIFKYDLENTPCEQVVKCDDICVFENNLKKSFPKDPYIDDMGAVSYIGSSLTDKNNKIIGLMSVMSKSPLLDIQKIKKLFSVYKSRVGVELERELSLQKANRSDLRLKAMVELSPICILIVDKDGIITFCNKVCKTIFEYEEKELVGQNIKIIMPSGKQRLSLNDFGCKKSGVLIPVDITLTPINDKHVMWSITDISERAAYEEKLVTLSMQDNLTGLPNRKAFISALHQSLSRAERNNTSLALLCIDIDNFKEINDSYGQHRGDDLLVLIGKNLRSTLRKGDYVARIGSDEFTVIVEYISSSDKGGDIANLIIDRLSEITAANPFYNKISISIGISIYPFLSDSPENFLISAETAMYEAKKTHGSSVFCYSKALNDTCYRKNKIKTQLKTMLINDELSLLYQPIVDINTNKIVGMEALSRWNNIELGHVPPDEFIPIAEEGTLIDEITAFVLNKACEDFSQLARNKTLTLSINLSYWNLMNKALASQVLAVLEKFKMKPENLILEITESTILQSNATIIHNLNTLSKSGVTFALDDFGTGNSSFTLINSLPISILKVDKSFVSAINHASKSEEIIVASIKLGSALSFDVILEGVETKEQLLFMREHEASLAQGYYFHKPMSIKSISNLINTRNAY